MVQTSTVCDSCGSHSVPKDARFCPTCGQRQGHTNHPEDDNSVVPMVAAVLVHDDGSSTTRSGSIGSGVPLTVQGQPLQQHGVADSLSTAEATTVTMDEACNPQVPMPPPVPYNNTHVNHSQQQDYSTEENKEEEYYAGATFYKHPTPEMLQHAKGYDAMGGILFIKASTCSFPYNKGCHDHSGGGGGHKWTVPETIHMGHILTGTHLDLSCADFIFPTTTITIGTVLGGAKIVVPRGVRVETRGLGILGGFQGLTTQTVNAHRAADAPLLVVQGLAILGGAKVEVNHNVPPLRVIQ